MTPCFYKPTGCYFFLESCSECLPSAGFVFLFWIKTPVANTVAQSKKRESSMFICTSSFGGWHFMMSQRALMYLPASLQLFCLCHCVLPPMVSFWSCGRFSTASYFKGRLWTDWEPAEKLLLVEFVSRGKGNGIHASALQWSWRWQTNVKTNLQLPAPRSVRSRFNTRLVFASSELVDMPLKFTARARLGLPVIIIWSNRKQKKKSTKNLLPQKQIKATLAPPSGWLLTLSCWLCLPKGTSGSARLAGR